MFKTTSNQKSNPIAFGEVESLAVTSSPEVQAFGEGSDYPCNLREKRTPSLNYQTLNLQALINE